MKWLLLLLVLWAAGVAGCFCIGGFVTVFFHASDAGLGLFILASIAWTTWLAVQVSRSLKGI